MITVYKKKTLPKSMDTVHVNDVFFNKYTVDKLDSRAESIIKTIDNAEQEGKFQIRSCFDGSLLNIDKLSTGCKTVLNIIYNPDRIFDIRECGDNVLDLIYSLDIGNVFCDYPVISFSMDKVIVTEKNQEKVIDDYDELKEWWIS